MSRELGKTRFNENGNVASFDKPCLEVTCGMGKLVAYGQGDEDEYSEIEIDLLAPDGRVLQLAVVGMDEEGWEWSPFDPPKGYQKMHVYSWDGVNGDEPHTQYVRVDEDSCWYE